MEDKVKCPVCGNDYNGDTLVDACDFCGWIYDYTEDTPNEKSGANPITLEEARQKLFKRA